MSLKNPWEVSSKPKSVPLYVDGEWIGTAERAVVRLEGFDGPIESVDLTDLSNRSVPVGRQHRNYDVIVRDQKIEELEAEVERLKESRKEQAERHKQKMCNLQHNFEQQSNGKTRNTKLKKQLESSQSRNEHLEQRIRDLDAELVGLKSKYYRQSLELDVRVKETKDLQADLEKAEQQRQNVADQSVKLMAENRRLKREQGNDSYWHEKYLESERAVADLSESRKCLYDRSIKLSTDLAQSRSENKKLVDDYNRLNDDINRFMDKHAEGAIVINEAVDAWNATVQE